MKKRVWEELSSAEDFLEFFDLPYDPQVVAIYRLHIMKKFSLLMREVRAESEEARFQEYKNAMEKAYTTFLSSSALQERLFKVLKDAAPRPIPFLPTSRK